MDKKTTLVVVKSLGITRKTLLTLLIYHPELRSSEQPQPLTLACCNHLRGSEAEIEHGRTHCTREKRAEVAA